MKIAQMLPIVFFVSTLCLFSGVKAVPQVNVTCERTCPRLDVVLAIDTAFFGWGDRSESDVQVDALLPFLENFTQILWRSRPDKPENNTRVAVVEMAKQSSILVELKEGINAKSVIDTFIEKRERRLSLEDRKTTTHIYRMMTLVNTSICIPCTSPNVSSSACHSTDPNNIPCILVVITVAPAPARVPFVGADWPTWRKFSDAWIRSAFDLGVSVMVLTTGYHESAGGKAAGLSEMARVEGRMTKELIHGEGDEASRIDWSLLYWQAGYDRKRSVDERVAKQTMSTICKILAEPKKPKEEQVRVEQRPPQDEEEEEKEIEETMDEEGYDSLANLLVHVAVASIIGFSVKQIWRLVFRQETDTTLAGRAFKVLMVNSVYAIAVVLLAWLSTIIFSNEELAGRFDMLGD